MTRTILGLTGSIGMGKSTTAAMFQELGVPVWDADTAVHRIYAAGAPGGAALSDIAPSAVGEDGAVDRGTLRAAIAENADLLKQIEARIHPLVAEDRMSFLDAHRDDDIVVLDIPLLFEPAGSKPWTRSSSSRPPPKNSAAASLPAPKWTWRPSSISWRAKPPMRKNESPRRSRHPDRYPCDRPCRCAGLAEPDPGRET
jgi:dephospho-CoA kinase